MQDKNATLHRLSAFVSVVGHPLLTAAVFILFLTFSQLRGKEVFLIPCIVIGIVIIPVTFWNYHQTKKGVYSNFDVSVRHQRKSFYLVSIGLLLLAAIVLHLTHQPIGLLYGMAFTLALMVVSFIANFFIKASLHTSVSFLLAFAMMTLHFWFGMVWIGFSFLIAFSRLVLQRHTPLELVVGAGIGITTGGGLYYLLTRPII